MSAIKFPSARQPVLAQDPQGNSTFTRAWFLFFQQIYDRVGGAIDSSANDAQLGQVTNSSELEDQVYDLAQKFGQAPVPDPQAQVNALQSEINELRSIVVEMRKEISGIQQNPMGVL
jgi:hypothetical protein